MRKPTIHSKPDELLAYHSERSADSLDLANQNLQSLNETARNQPTKEDTQNLANKLDDVSRLTQNNHPFEVVQKLDEVKDENISANEKLANLERQAEQSADLMKTLIREVKSRALPVELVGMEQVVIQGEQGVQGEKGDKGERGEKGEQGIQGIQGEQGEKGDKGDRGQDGQIGATGKQGIAGIDGKDGARGFPGINGSPDTGQEIVAKLTELPYKEKLSYQALKDLPKIYDPSDFPVGKGGRGGGGGQQIRFRDSNSAEISAYVTDLQFGSGLSPTYSSGKITLTASGSIGGSGVANELPYWVDATTLGSLTTATYPTLTELSYVKGLTSSAQTQINTKAPSTSPTFATSITGSYLTASEILITDGSKNIVSAPVATYPSLTELTYLKGVTSAIQTQLNGKQATITFGTGVQTALGINVGSAGAFITFNGDAGTPSALVGTNISGTAASFTAGTATLANTVASANEATDTTCFPLFITASGTQTLATKNNTGFTYNSNTNDLGITKINGLTMTASTGTFTLTNAKTLSVTNTLTFSGTDSTVMTFPTTSATIARADGALTQFTANNNWKVWYSDGSGDVTELALGASGTVLTSGGASSAPSFATPGGGDDNFSTTYYIYSSGFGGAAGSSTGTSGGSLTDGGVGYVGLNTSTTAGSAETTWVYRGGTVDYSKNMWGRLQMTRFLIETTTAAAQTHATMFNFTNDSTTLATKYAGWRIEGGNPATWYAVVKNGTTETASSGLSSMPASNTFGTYILDVIYTSSSITYYYNGTLKATLTTNIPTGSTATSDNTLFQGKIKNGTDAIDANIRFNAFTAKITL